MPAITTAPAKAYAGRNGPDGVESGPSDPYRKIEKALMRSPPPCHRRLLRLSRTRCCDRHGFDAAPMSTPPSTSTGAGMTDGMRSNSRFQSSAAIGGALVGGSRKSMSRAGAGRSLICLSECNQEAVCGCAAKARAFLRCNGGSKIFVPYTTIVAPTHGQSLR